MVFNDERVPRWVILYRLPGLSLKVAVDDLARATRVEQG
jgi:hypothetical protein